MSAWASEAAVVVVNVPDAEPTVSTVLLVAAGIADAT
jgi:hypothetical protein